MSPDDRRSLKVVVTDRGHGLEVLDGGVMGFKNDEARKDGDEYAPGSVLLYDGRHVGLVERVLGRGAFGTVHRFLDRKAKETLAMKSLSSRDGRTCGAQLEEMLCQEAGFSFAVGTHANLVSIRKVLVPLPGLRESNIRSSSLIFSDVVEGRSLDKWMGVSGGAFVHDGPLYNPLPAARTYNGLTLPPKNVDGRLACIAAQLCPRSAGVASERDALEKTRDSLRRKKKGTSASSTCTGAA